MTDKDITQMRREILSDIVDEAPKGSAGGGFFAPRGQYNSGRNDAIVQAKHGFPRLRGADEGGPWYRAGYANGDAGLANGFDELLAVVMA